MYDGLSQHAGWRHLRKQVEAQEGKFLHRMVHRLRHGDVLDQREIDYTRGFLDGATFLLSRPDVAETSLEAAATSAFAIAADEVESREEGASPYA